MSNEKHYRYYLSDETKCKEMLGRYDKEIASQRDGVLENLLKESGALAYTPVSNWGRAETIAELVFKPDHSITTEKYVKTRISEFENEPVICVRGKNNSNAGKSFNHLITEVNKTLSSLPKFTDWVVSELGLMKTGFGASTGRGTAMLQTKGGTVGEVLGFMVPRSDDEKHGTVEIPDCLTEVTYGQWYDLTNEDE